jgi:hypothetical protein
MFNYHSTLYRHSDVTCMEVTYVAQRELQQFARLAAICGSPTLTAHALAIHAQTLATAPIGASTNFCEAGETSVSF